MNFKFEAVDQQGTLINGLCSAATVNDAMRELENKQLQVISLQDAYQKHQHKESRRHGKLKRSDIILALYEMATMLASGVAINEAVSAQSDSIEHPELSRAFERMGKALRAGETFSRALEESRLNLPDYLYQLVAAGEVSGKLAGALKDSIEQMEYDQKIASEIRNALIYPSILIISGILAVLVMFVFVVPSFAGLLDKSEELPFLAYAVLSLGVWTNAHMLEMGLTVIVLIFTAVLLLKKPSIRLSMMRFISKFPVLGDWLSEAEIARWSKVLSILLANRVPLIQALEIAYQGIKLPQRQSALSQVTRDVRSGTAMSAALDMNQAISSTGVNLIRVGEKSGKVSAMLHSLATLYEENSQTRMKAALLLIEPIAILAIGAVIGVIIIGIILAITSANNIVI